MLIKDLVAIDEDAEFRNDVQISDYDNKDRNLALLRSYLFTHNAPKEQESSLSLLRLITGAFSDARTKNRFAVIANYGHGKSHLALVMANYFSKPYGSPEINVIFEKISKAADNQANAKYFRDFRQNHAEYLVVRLRGDVQRTLREQFVSNLEQALKEPKATQEVQLPFWYQTAEDWLNQLSEENKTKASQFLKDYNTDVPLLLQDIRQKHDNTYEVSRNLHKHIHGTLPDFGGEVSLRELVNWVADKYCGDNKPLSGILVLFDEFSLYIQRYAQRNASGELQDLLNGIQDQQGKTVFLAFAQQDPGTIAHNVMKGTLGLDGLEKELSRVERKPKLYSLMESVIKSYLTQPDGKWREIRADARIRGPLVKASDLTMRVFTKRYEDILRWDSEKFDEIITKGCFPLHPLTTAMLCDLQLQAIPKVGNPRTVLGFVFEQIKAKQGQSIAIDTKINWVLPISLVEYFGEYLPETAYALYNNAIRILGEDASPDWIALLQALLLQEASRLPVKKDTQLQFLSEAAGIDSEEIARQHLKALCEKGCIRFDPSTKMNYFMSVTANPHRLEEILNQRLEVKNVTKEVLDKLNYEVTKSIDIGVDWGSPEDWQAGEIILTKPSFTVNRLQEIITRYKFTYSNELQESIRGNVIWLVAQNEDDVSWFRQNASIYLIEAYPEEDPPPIILIFPQRPCPELIDDYLRLIVLRDFSDSDRKEVGMDIYDYEKGRLDVALDKNMATVRGDHDNYLSLPRALNSWIVPARYLSTLQALSRPSLEQILKECYRNAYRFSPPEFFTQYRVAGQGQNKLREATHTVAAALLRNSLSKDRDAISSNRVAKDLGEKFLWKRWQLITADYRIQEPGDHRILEGWNILEQCIPPGAQDARVREVLVKLFNPPYGYDYNTVTLLFSAWIGYHIHDLDISIQGRREKLVVVATMLSDGGKKFIQKICITQPMSISRRDQGQIIREIKELIEHTNRDSLTQDEAQEAITKLQSFSTDQGSQPDLCESASLAAENLSEGLNQAKKYDEKVSLIIKIVKEESNIHVIISLHHQIAELPHVSNVKYMTSSPSQLEQEWCIRLEKLVESECHRLENIQRTAQIELHQKQLDDLKKQLNKANLKDMVTRVEAALEIIRVRSAELDVQEREQPIQVEIRSMDSKAQLKTLYEYRQRLQKISDCSSATLQLRDERLYKIENEIIQLESFAQSLQDGIECLNTFKAVDAWQNSFLRQIERFQDTTFHEELEMASKRVHQILEIFKELELISGKASSNFQEATAYVNKILEIQDSAKSWLGSEQKQLIDRVLQGVNQHVQQKVAEARQWLLTLTSDFEKGAFVKVTEKIKLPPEFFPESERLKLTELTIRVQQKMDQDVVTRIEMQFREITDPSTRQACLNRLKQIFDENF